jgi:hypothetical protein
VQPNSKNSYSLGISLSENAYDALNSGFHQELIKMVRQLNDSPNHNSITATHHHNSTSPRL